MTDKTPTAAAGAAARNLSCSEMWFAGWLARNDPLDPHRPCDGLSFGEILPVAAVPLLDGGDLIVGDDRIGGDVRTPHSGVSEA